MSRKNNLQNRSTATQEESNSRKARAVVLPDYGASDISQLASKNGAYYFTAAVFVVSFAVTCFIFWQSTKEVGIVALLVSLIVAVLVSSCLHVAQQWERAVILRLGKFKRVKGPGLFLTLPIIEHCTIRIDQRIRATPFGAEETLTSDLVPLNVDAVLFWFVWDSEKACTEVGDFGLAVQMSAQTALRDAIGRASVAEVAVRRTQLDRELERILEEKVAPWGISILSVEVRDIILPKELQEVMSLEAQAEQRKKARIILMEAEQDISEMLVDIGKTYSFDEQAFKLRSMHLLYEGVKETGGTVVIPSAWGDSFGDQLPLNFGKK